MDELFAFELLDWPEPQPLPPTPADDHECGLRDTASSGWEQKLAPFLMMAFREKVGASMTARDRISIVITVQFWISSL